MNPSKLLTACWHELKRCAISLLFIVIGLFLATANAPAAEATALTGSAEPNPSCPRIANFFSQR
ncbi:hypothetical protein A1507_05915 [Methylomonas koyamae]|uniref:Uncharacterized protein n=1 Tax=Methylomonas koyamae TaxID=702114 RepID=A0A177NPI1_9GAMM|nr:hypothetical protein [Methylomonas koyamae]OAI19885.1 hypothetical protein A1507_05915 [Methylomonas koyamae]